ncbi:MAG TPA: protein phosphatase 2C domain-containing protein, partial [Pyrinomonadaceae bacterium]|nr:protein phosphatase 2C domain-containing protein [Pyrinomonadaceae bacterium]
MTDTSETSPAPPAAAPPAANGAETNAPGEAADATEKPAPPNAQTPSPPQVAATETRVDAPPAAAPADDALIAARSVAEWRVIGETVPGASHLRAGIPNQDAILYVRQSSARLPLIVSISDGHGSNKCFRSDRGSRFAVRTGADLLDELIHGRHAALPPAELESRVRERLTREFVKRWRAAVAADLKREPFREE